MTNEALYNHEIVIDKINVNIKVDFTFTIYQHDKMLYANYGISNTLSIVKDKFLQN